MITLRIQARVHRAFQLQQIHDAELREREREGSRVSKVVAAGDWVSAFAEAAERNVPANHDDLVVLARHHLFSSSQSLASSSICCQACLARPSNHRVSRFVYLNIQAAHPSDLARVPAQYRALDCYSLDFGGDEDDHAL